MLERIKHKYPEFIDTNGKKVIIEIINNGKCSKPCKMCLKLLKLNIPEATIIYTNQDNIEVKQSVSSIEKTKHSFGTINRYKYKKHIY